MLLACVGCAEEILLADSQVASHISFGLSFSDWLTGGVRGENENALPGKRRFLLISVSVTSFDKAGEAEVRGRRDGGR